MTSEIIYILNAGLRMKTKRVLGL